MIQDTPWMPARVPIATTTATAADNATTQTGTSTTVFVTPAGLAYAAPFHAAPVVNPRAAAQGLVFNGTAGASAACSVAIGTGPFTFETVLEIPLTAPSGDAGFFFLSDLATAGLRPYCLIGYMTSTGVLSFSLYGATTSDYRLATVAGFQTAYAGKMVCLAFVRPSSGNPVLYVNGVATALSLSSAGTAPTWQDTVYSSFIGIGSYSTTALWTGAIHRPALYNREHSAADVLARYEDGRPLAADYNNASNTSLITGDNSTFATDTGFWTRTGTASIGSNVCTLPGTSSIFRPALCTIGKRYRITLTLSGGSVSITNADLVTYGTISGAGTGSLEFTAQAAAAIQIVNFSGSITVDNVTLLPLGAIFAPEANAAGNGYQWKDMSGNKADITVPTSGVSWAVPSNRPNSVRGTLTWSGTHESKSLLGQRALPDGAVLTLLTRKATVASSGSGATIGTTNSATRWQAAATYTTAKAVGTIANALPAGTAAGDNDIVVDPDTANYTGSIEVEAHYAITQPT